MTLLRRSLLVLITAILAQVVLGQPPPIPLHPLYETSDPSISWPPEGRDFSSSDPKDWPGSGERFGQSWPRQKVPILDFAPEPQDFFRDYVSIRKPVMFKGILQQMTTQKKNSFDMKSTSLVNQARAALAGIEVQYTNKPDKNKMSFREFLQSQSPEAHSYTNDHINYVFKSEIAMPSMLKCQEAIAALHDTRHTYFSYTFPFPLRQERNHQLVCQIEGEKEILLIDPKDFIGLGDLKMTEEPNYKRRAFSFNAYNVDYEAVPTFKNIKKFHIAKMVPGQCLYVPEGWLHQHVVYKGDHSLELRWGPIYDVNEAELKCEGKVSAATLGDVAWPGEGVEKPAEKSTDHKRRDFENLAYVMNLLLMSSESKDLTAFEEIVKVNGKLLPSLPEWNEETEATGKDVFRILDRNKDGVLDIGDTKDLVGLSEKELRDWAGVLLDRYRFKNPSNCSRFIIIFFQMLGLAGNCIRYARGSGWSDSA